MGYTRGQPPCPVTGLGGTLPSRELLNYPSNLLGPPLNLALLKTKYRQYFGYLMARLYNTKDPSKPKDHLEPNSYLWKLRKGRNYNSSTFKKLRLNLDLYNAGSKINYLFLSINEQE